MKEQLRKDLTDLMMQASLVLPKNKLDKITISTDKETFDILTEAMYYKDEHIHFLDIPGGIHKSILAFEVTENKETEDDGIEN